MDFHLPDPPDVTPNVSQVGRRPGRRGRVGVLHGLRGLRRGVAGDGVAAGGEGDAFGTEVWCVWEGSEGMEGIGSGVLDEFLEV